MGRDFFFVCLNLCTALKVEAVSILYINIQQSQTSFSVTVTETEMMVIDIIII